MTYALSNIIDPTSAPTPPRWFEFVFAPDRLEQHLEISPIELITSFFKNLPELDTMTSSNNIIQHNTNNGINTTNGIIDNIESSEPCDVIIPPGSYEAKYRLKKTYALQTLALKVASHLKWDLDALCEGLSIPIQCKLMQTFKKACEHENCSSEVKMFASVIYCRWFLRSSIAYKLFLLQPQSSSTTIIYLSQLQQQQQTADTLALMSMGELFAETRLKSCVDELHDFIWKLIHNNKGAKKFKTSNHPFKRAKLSRPKPSCFDSRDEELNNWGDSEAIEPLEFIEAACYDLGRSLFFDEHYSQAKEVFDLIRSSHDKFPLLGSFLKSANDILTLCDRPTDESECGRIDDSQVQDKFEDQPTAKLDENFDQLIADNSRKRRQTEKYLFDCMSQYSKVQLDKASKQTIDESCDDLEEDTDMRIELQGTNHQRLPENSAWYLQTSIDEQQQQLLEMGKGDLFMSRGNFKQAMGCFIGALMLITDYFRTFTKNYIDEEPLITRMIQCSISSSCYTQAVALCQMTKNLNYTIAFKQLNERVCNDCCDDIYECIWNVTILEYIINLHAKRGEVDRRTKVIQLIGQLELNENNPEEILREAENVRRGRFFRILSNKYL